MRVFRIAMTGDFLDESAAVAYGDIGLAAWSNALTSAITS